MLNSVIPDGEVEILKRNENGDVIVSASECCEFFVERRINRLSEPAPR
jgi:hypothetical protein